MEREGEGTGFAGLDGAGEEIEGQELHCFFVYFFVCAGGRIRVTVLGGESGCGRDRAASRVPNAGGGGCGWLERGVRCVVNEAGTVVV